SRCISSRFLPRITRHRKRQTPYPCLSVFSVTLRGQSVEIVPITGAYSRTIDPSLAQDDMRRSSGCQILYFPREHSPKHSAIDIPAAEHDAHALALETVAQLRQRREAHRTRALHEVVRQRDDRTQTLRDLGIGHRDEAGESLLQRREREIVG